MPILELYRFETKKGTYQALIPMAWVKSINSRQGKVTAIPYFKDGKKLNFKSSALKLKSFSTWLKLINETSTFNAHVLYQKSEQSLHKFFKEISLKAKYCNFIHIFWTFQSFIRSFMLKNGTYYLVWKLKFG